MDMLDVEISSAAGEQALQALLQLVNESVGKLEAHDAEQCPGKRLLPSGLAVMTLYVAQRGTGEIRAAVTWPDGMILPRATQLQGRDYCSLFGERSTAGKPRVQQQLTAMLRGWVGYVIGSLRQILSKRRLRKLGRETLRQVITFFHNRRRWMQCNRYLAVGLPVGTGVVEIGQL